MLESLRINLLCPPIAALLDYFFLLEQQIAQILGAKPFFISLFVTIVSLALSETLIADIFA